MLGRSPSASAGRSSATCSRQRERVVPPVPAERLKAGPWTGRSTSRQARAAQADRRRSNYRLSRPPVGPEMWATGRRCSSAAGCASCGRTVRVPGSPSTDGSTPAGRFGNAGRGACRDGRSRFPIPGRVPISNARREASPGARSAIGKPTRHQVGDATCTEVERRTRFLMARVVSDKTAGEASRSWTFLAAAGRRARQRHARQRHRVRPPRCATRLGKSSPTPYSAGSGKQREPQRRQSPVSAQTLHRQRSASTRSTTAPCACSPHAPPKAFADELLELQDQQRVCTSK